VGTDRGEDNAKGIAETILKHLEKKIKSIKKYKKSIDASKYLWRRIS
jgi:hypothetical protein